MSFQRFQVVTGPDRDIVVNLSGEAYVRVMDRINLYHYESGNEYEYHGPSEKVTTARIKVPSLGRWFIIVDDSQVSVEWSLLE
jgi:hypothetical protein